MRRWASAMLARAFSRIAQDLRHRLVEGHADGHEVGEGQVRGDGVGDDHAPGPERFEQAVGTLHRLVRRGGRRNPRQVGVLQRLPRGRGRPGDHLDAQPARLRGVQLRDETRELLRRLGDQREARRHARHEPHELGALLGDAAEVRRMAEPRDAKLREARLEARLAARVPRPGR
jgi:hypothetical protein